MIRWYIRERERKDEVETEREMPSRGFSLDSTLYPARVCVRKCLVKPQADLKTNTRASLWNDKCVKRVSREQSRANERKWRHRERARAKRAQAQRGPEKYHVSSACLCSSKSVFGVLFDSVIYGCTWASWILCEASGKEGLEWKDGQCVMEKISFKTQLVKIYELTLRKFQKVIFSLNFVCQLDYG